MTSPAHLVVRIPLTGGPIEKVIAHHQVIAREHGTVWFGTSGQPPSALRREALSQQLARKIPMYLHVVQRSLNDLRLFRAPLRQFDLRPPKGGHLVPTYYSDKVGFKPVLWLRVEPFEELPSGTLDRLYVQKTGNPIRNAILKGMSSLLIVSEGLGQPKPPPYRRLWNPNVGWRNT